MTTGRWKATHQTGLELFGAARHTRRTAATGGASKSPGVLLSGYKTIERVETFTFSGIPCLAAGAANDRPAVNLTAGIGLTGRADSPVVMATS